MEFQHCGSKLLGLDQGVQAPLCDTSAELLQCRRLCHDSTLVTAEFFWKARGPSEPSELLLVKEVLLSSIQAMSWPLWRSRPRTCQRRLEALLRLSSMESHDPVPSVLAERGLACELPCLVLSVFVFDASCFVSCCVASAAVPVCSWHLVCQAACCMSACRMLVGEGLVVRRALVAGPHVLYCCRRLIHLPWCLIHQVIYQGRCAGLHGVGLWPNRPVEKPLRLVHSTAVRGRGLDHGGSRLAHLGPMLSSWTQSPVFEVVLAMVHLALVVVFLFLGGWT